MDLVTWILVVDTPCIVGAAAIGSWAGGIPTRRLLRTEPKRRAASGLVDGCSRLAVAMYEEGAALCAETLEPGIRGEDLAELNEAVARANVEMSRHLALVLMHFDREDLGAAYRLLVKKHAAAMDFLNVWRHAVEMGDSESARLCVEFNSQRIADYQQAVYGISVRVNEIMEL